MDGPWKVYFRLNDQPLEEAIRFINEEIRTKSIWYFHPNGTTAGPHIHALIWNHEQTAETLRNKIKRRFNLVNKTHYGISNKYERGTLMSEETVPTYITYMSKGQYDPIYMKDYTDEYANERKREWKAPTAVHISGDLTVITHGEVKTKRITMYWLSREAENEYLETHDAQHMIDNGLNVRDIETIVKKVFSKYEKSCPPRLCADIIGDICGRLAPNHYHSQVKRYLGMTPGINFYT